MALLLTLFLELTLKVLVYAAPEDCGQWSKLRIHSDDTYFWKSTDQIKISDAVDYCKSAAGGIPAVLPSADDLKTVWNASPSGFQFSVGLSRSSKGTYVWHNDSECDQSCLSMLGDPMNQQCVYASTEATLATVNCNNNFNYACTRRIQSCSVNSERDCPVGSSVSGSSCQLCSPGKYQNNPNSLTFCQNCPSGRFSFYFGMSYCELCQPGYYSSGAWKSCRKCPEGKFAQSEESGSCDQCPKGRYSPNEGSTGCLSCPLGKFQNFLGSSTCFCSNGEYSLGHDSPCQDCDVGKYMNSSSAQTSCIECEVGKFQNSTKQSGCYDCDLGKYQNERSSSLCEVCDPGRFSNSLGSALCTLCNAGEYQNSTSQSKCFECNPGKFSIKGSVDCEDCELGKYSPSAGSTNCILCPGGYYQNITGADFCYGCPAGTESSPGSTSCSLCAPGFYSQAAQPSCTPCNPGFYSEEFGSSNVESCKSCPAGTANNFNGQSKCFDCKPGKYTPIESTFEKITCLSCELGRFSPNERSIECEECSFGQYSDVIESTKCSECPQGRYGELKGASSLDACTQCPQGRYNPLTGRISVEDCQLCVVDEGIDCPVGSAWPTLLGGYWRGSDDPNRILRCVPSYACKQAIGEALTECEVGYTGQACSECARLPNPYYRSGIECKPCGGQVMKWLLFAALFLGLIFAVTRLMTAPSQYPFADLRIATNWLQYIALFPRISNDWPPALTQLFSFTTLVNFDIQFFAVECDTKISFWTLWKLKLIAPILIMVSYVIFYYAYPLYLKFRAKLGQNLRLGSNFKNQLIYSLTFCMNLLYTLLIATVVSPLNCFRQSDGTYSQAQDPSVTCFGPEWRSNFPFFIFSAILYGFGFPFFLGLVFYWNRNNVDDPTFISRFGSLVLPYRREYFWWELLNIIHKCITVLFGQFFSSSISVDSRIFLVVLALFSRTYAENLFKPYRTKWVNGMALTWGLIDAMILSTIWVFTSPETKKTERGIFIVMVILVFVSALLFSLYHLYQSMMSYSIRKFEIWSERYEKHLEKISRKKHSAYYLPSSIEEEEQEDSLHR